VQTVIAMAGQAEAPAGPAEAPAGLEDIWPRLRDVMAHLAAVRLDEAGMMAQQRGTLRDGRFLLPSLFPGRESDACEQSWFHEHQVFYRFDAGPHGRYFVVTGLLDRGYSLDSIWFPERGVAVTNYPSEISGPALERFGAMVRIAPPKPPDPAPRAVVHGYPHFMHMLWNELPALHALEAAGVEGPVSIGALFEPFGPAAALFPGLAGRIAPMRLEDVAEANAAHGLTMALGSWRIPVAVQERVRAVCRLQASTAVIAARDRFRARYPGAIWISVKPPNRTLARQGEVLAALVVGLAARYPDRGFIVDGASLPWDFPANPNYEPWFHAGMQAATVGSAAIMAEITARLPAEVLARTIRLNGLSVCDEAVWAEAASFYVCHGGTMQNKIGWLHRVPGFVHSNHAFLESVRWSPPVVVDGLPCHLASAGLIEDEAAEGYTALELARKDQNYRVVSDGLLLDEVCAALEA